MDDPNVERKKAARALARFLRLHPRNIAQKTEVMVEHFNAAARHKIGGRAKANHSAQPLAMSDSLMRVPT